MTSIQPELWVDNPGQALRFYEAAFGATVLHCVGEGGDLVAQLSVGDAAFWVAGSSPSMRRLRAGATETSPVDNEHGWRLGRILDPFGHEWEIGAPLGNWPPSSRERR
jgi:PhnB protein